MWYHLNILCTNTFSNSQSLSLQLISFIFFFYYILNNANYILLQMYNPYGKKNCLFFSGIAKQKMVAGRKKKWWPIEKKNGCQYNDQINPLDHILNMCNSVLYKQVCFPSLSMLNKKIYPTLKSTHLSAKLLSIFVSHSNVLYLLFGFKKRDHENIFSCVHEKFSSNQWRR